MAIIVERDFNRSALTVKNKHAWYTGQQAQKIPQGLVGVVGYDCVSLDLSYNELTSVSALKDYQYLEELILDNNNLRDLRTLPLMPKLKTLSINNNKVKDIDVTLERIKECCPNVTYLSLLGNPGYPDQLTDPMNNDEADYNRYRLYAIFVLPNTLRFLDFRSISKQEFYHANTRGKFLRTVKLATSSLSNKPNDMMSFDDIDGIIDVNYSPLPTSNRNLHDHKGAYGKCRYRYSGKNSEGNRFILNNDL
ncbi:hypothetical protein HCN44_003581 [Aphidius gifuensis]|uniref:Leucine-rich melanocyte differentiation-associated protein-like n=1 Tax=Aphidius gifuensis TaxID=684658 RepID=A0A834XII4_APHGI|nr:leucine-rich melanocyte differentiation-associated protein-like [Aphidius gifuensis]KAF7987718.1 hypothetical protein HCN44_003581 [Aphidius gifuensis]